MKQLFLDGPGRPRSPELDAWKDADWYHIIGWRDDPERQPIVVRIAAEWVAEHQGETDFGQFMQGVLMDQEIALQLGDPGQWYSSLSSGVPHIKLLSRSALYDWNVDDLD